MEKARKALGWTGIVTMKNGTKGDARVEDSKFTREVNIKRFELDIKGSNRSTVSSVPSRSVQVQVSI